MAAPNLVHHNQLQLLNQQQRQQNPAYAKERVQAIIQVCSTLVPCAYTSIHILKIQRAHHLRAQGFTAENNQELQNLLRFISNLQTQHAQQNGVFIHRLIRTSFASFYPT